MPKELIRRKKDILLFDLFLVLLALVFFLATLGLNFRAWLFPGVFSLILLLMTALQTLADYYPEKQTFQFVTSHSQARGGEEKTSLEGKSDRSKHARAGLVIFSLLAFYLIFRFLTIYVAIPVLCVLLLGWLTKKTWPVVALIAVSVDIFIYVIFQLLFQTSL